MNAAFSDPNLQLELCAWYHANRRDLPWRANTDPYRVWISEVMLQQTRVEVVIEAFERFVARFPTLAKLADADEADVLALWSGLGYYRRARGLHAAAGEIVRAHGGEFPRVSRDALALTGVGRYTAGAVLSIAFGQAEPIVDGNIARVFARWFKLTDPVGSGPLNKQLWAFAERLLPVAGKRDTAANPGDWNQALMELGATTCTPTSPRCEVCPVRSRCGAHASGRELELPVKPPKRERTPVRIEVLLIERDGKQLVVQRPDSGRMAGLWEPPTRELDSAELWPETFPTTTLAAGFDLEPDVLAKRKHSITRYAIDVVVRRGVLVGDGVPSGRPARFVTPVELEQLAITGLAKKVLGSQRGNYSPR